MCGIAGQIVHTQAGVASAERMSQQLQHRGPDDWGFYAESSAGSRLTRDATRLGPHPWLVLAHRRLAIVDLTDAASQPMRSHDGRYVLVFNGEIYNYLELREQLVGLGCQFRSQSDSEVLLQALIQWGVDALPRLIGMFAFAFLDTTTQQLLLARDFFGIKPLYYSATHEQFSFSSEPQVLVEQQEHPRANAQRLFHYLRWGVTDFGHETLYANIVQVPPAHYLLVDLNSPVVVQEPIQYWRLKTDRPIDISIDEAAEQLRDLFMESVRLHMRSDVALGAALSGGIDSSAIVMAMREIGGRKLDLHLFSYVADEEGICEEHWVDLVAKAAHAEVHKVRVSVEELVRDLDAVMAAQDEPFVSTSICVQNRVFRLAREHDIKVMLDGQGADELLAGYRPYQAARLASLARSGRGMQSIRFWQRASDQPGSGKRWLAIRAAKMAMPAAAERWLRKLVVRDLIPDWLNAAWFRDRQVDMSPFATEYRRDVLRGQLQASVERTSLPQLLRYEDRNSMAHSIESRVPFLTPQLASFIFSLPESFLVSDDGTSKFVFRQAMQGIVPEAILARRDKIGFATPEKMWMRALTPWINQLVERHASDSLPVIRMHQAERHLRRQANGDGDWDWSVWRWINLVKWAQQHPGLCLPSMETPDASRFQEKRAA